jgi:hypothetical protein
VDLGLRLTRHFEAHPEQRFALLVPAALAITAWAVWRMTALFALPEISSVSHIIGAVLIGVLVLTSGSTLFQRTSQNWRRSAFASLALLAAIAVVPAFGDSSPSALWAEAAVLGLAFWAAFGLLLLLTGVRTKAWEGNGPWYPGSSAARGPMRLCDAQFRVIANGYAPDEVDRFLSETRKRLEGGEGISQEEVDAVTFTVTENGYSIRAVDALLEDLSSHFTSID